MQTIIIAIIGSGALSALISGLFSVYTKRKEVKSALNEGMSMLLLAELKRSGEAFVSKGRIDVDDLEAYNKMYSIYHDKDKLNGNGFAEAIVSKVRALPLDV